MTDAGERAVATTDIAIVGMVGRFPGANDVREFACKLYAGVECISRFSDEELLAAGVSPERIRDQRYVKAKGIVHGIEHFDHQFFGIEKDQSDLMDPQHRVFLEAAWQLMESSGYDPASFGGRIGVYAGAALNTYVLNNLRRVDARYERFNPIDLLIFTDKDFLPTLVSYHLGLQGPSVAVQTACSTSLVAVHLGCQGLIDAECDLAIAGAITLFCPQVKGYLYEPGNLVSPDGRIRSFAAGANGTVYGSGYGLVALKRAADAIRDGDTIHAVIQATAVNNDGSRKPSFKAPSEDGIAEVAGMALAMAGVEPNQVGYLEGNGSGTALGDRIELAALTRAYRRSAHDAKTLLGSVKPNIGHLNVAAGMAALLKTVLVLQHDDIPPSINCVAPDPSIDWDTAPLRVAAVRQSWPRMGAVRMAGINSYGVGGTNAHVILREPPRRSADPDRVHGPLLFVLSAKTEASLTRAAARLQRFLQEPDGPDLRDVAFTLQVGRRSFERRLAVVAADRGELCAALERPTVSSPGPLSVVGFVFPEQPADATLAWARRLVETQPLFLSTGHDWLGGGSAAPYDLTDLMTDPLGSSGVGCLADTAGVAAFAALYTAARMYRALGVVPGYATGDGVGGLVAECLMGRMDALAAVGELRRRRTAVDAHARPAPASPGIVLRFGVDTAALGADGGQVIAAMPHTDGSALEIDRAFWGSLGSLWQRGCPVEWSRAYESGRRRRVPLPTYSFEPTRCWIERPRDSAPSSFDAAS